MIGNIDSAADGIVIALQQASAVTTFLGAATRIHQEIAQQGDPFPLILVQSLPSIEDQRTSDDELILATPIFRVIGCCEGRSRFAYLNPLTVAIDAALHKIGFMVDGNRLDFTRMRQYRRTFVDAGRHYTQRGFDYKVVTQ